MGVNLAQSLMDEFARTTGLVGDAAPRRYLWTDAFAVCNFLGLHRETGEKRYLQLALTLVQQVHHHLGRHRPDDRRQGWISGLSEEEGAEHPTCGGLRIGKPLNERSPQQPLDPRQEWDRDGQYFHYLTKWIHALQCVGRQTGDVRYLQWAAEMAIAAHRAFTYEVSPDRPQRMFWKMSIDLSRPLVPSMGHHDPLDGLITFLTLQQTETFPENTTSALAQAITDMAEMCRGTNWQTDDPLGIGGLLHDASRLAHLIATHDVPYWDLLRQLWRDADVSLQAFSRSSPLTEPANDRLAFRELGLSIGLHAIELSEDIIRRLARDRTPTESSVERLFASGPLAVAVEAFWSDPVHRRANTWTDHRDINCVMLATSLMPQGFVACG